jgi:hypothetical protein
MKSVNVHAAIRTTLRAALDHAGTSFEGCVNSFRGFDDHLARAGVFRRAGQACRVCGTTIERVDSRDEAPATARSASPRRERTRVSELGERVHHGHPPIMTRE